MIHLTKCLDANLKIGFLFIQLFVELDVLTELVFYFFFIDFVTCTLNGCTLFAACFDRRFLVFLCFLFGFILFIFVFGFVFLFAVVFCFVVGLLFILSAVLLFILVDI